MKRRPFTAAAPSKVTKKALKRCTKKDPLFFLDGLTFIRQTVTDKIYGCIVGSALGDTIGLYTDFLTKKKSAEVYEHRKFQLVEPTTELDADRHRTRFTPKAWNDDTDQALLILLSYLHRTTHGHASSLHHNAHESGIDRFERDYTAHLHIWLEQGLLALNRHARSIGALVGSVVNHQQYHERPVMITIDAWVELGHNAALNGSLMRTHPIGVIGVRMSEEEAWDLAVKVGSMTHFDPRCSVSCCIQVALVRGLIRGEIVNKEDVDACIERSYSFVKDNSALMKSDDPSKVGKKSIEARLDREELEKCLRAKSLGALELDEEGLIGYVYLIMEGGGAYTNAAAACALLGAYLEYANLPAHWALGLVHKTWLMGKTQRLIIAVGVAVEDGELEVEAGETGRRYKLDPMELAARSSVISAAAKKRMKDGGERRREKKAREERHGEAL